jgi:hypothetical protein
MSVSHHKPRQRPILRHKETNPQAAIDVEAEIFAELFRGSWTSSGLRPEGFGLRAPCARGRTDRGRIQRSCDGSHGGSRVHGGAGQSVRVLRCSGPLRAPARLAETRWRYDPACGASAAPHRFDAAPGGTWRRSRSRHSTRYLRPLDDRSQDLPSHPHHAGPRDSYANAFNICLAASSSAASPPSGPGAGP